MLLQGCQQLRQIFCFIAGGDDDRQFSPHRKVFGCGCLLAGGYRRQAEKKSASLPAKQRRYQRAVDTQSSSFLVLVFSFGDHLTDLLATEGHHRHAGTGIDRTANEVKIVVAFAVFRVFKAMIFLAIRDRAVDGAAM